MPRYKVTYWVQTTASAIVEAEDEDQARKKADSLSDDQYEWESAEWELAETYPEDNPLLLSEGEE